MPGKWKQPCHDTPKKTVHPCAGKRLWFTHASEQTVYKTQPYLFQHLQAPGQTYAIKMPGTRSVLAIDVTFSSLSEYISDLPLSRESEIYLYQSNGQINASNQKILPEKKSYDIDPIPLTSQEQTWIKQAGTIKISNEMDWPPLDFAVAGEPRGYAIDLIRLLAHMTGLKIEFINGYTWPELLDQFKNGDIDVIHPVVRSDMTRDIGVFSDPLITLPQAVVTRPGSDPITTLPQDLHLIIHPRHHFLVPILNKALAAIPDRQRQAMKETWLPFDPEIAQAPAQSLVSVPYSRLIQIAGQKALENQLHKTVINGKDHFVFVTLLDPDPSSREYFAVVVPSRQVLADCLERLKTSILITIACMILLLPLCWLFATPVVNPIKRLAAENRKIKHRQYDEVTLCSSVIKEIHDLAISLVDMSEAIQQHEQQQADLMDAVIQTIARAIDDKSPYTGQHCARVPELALMMVRAADRSNTPPFDRFSFHSKDQLREFQIGAWLHDCGKIITPEHIMNKGTKLETIYNRIHEIRMRFEVLWRDAQIQTLEKKWLNRKKTGNGRKNWQTHFRHCKPIFPLSPESILAQKNCQKWILNESRHWLQSPGSAISMIGWVCHPRKHPCILIRLRPCPQRNICSATNPGI
jgi:hypothetical protein